MHRVVTWLIDPSTVRGDVLICTLHAKLAIALSASERQSTSNLGCLLSPSGSTCKVPWPRRSEGRDKPFLLDKYLVERTCRARGKYLQANIVSIVVRSCSKCGRDNEGPHSCHSADFWRPQSRARSLVAVRYSSVHAVLARRHGF